MDERSYNVAERRKLGSSWINILLAFWIIISLFVLGLHAPKAIWNNVVTGILVGALLLSAGLWASQAGAGLICSLEYGWYFRRSCWFSAQWRCGIT